MTRSLLSIEVAMRDFPTIRPWTVLLAAVVSYAWSGLYFAAVAPALGRAVGAPDLPETVPASALIIAFLTRVVVAFGIAAILGFAGVHRPGIGALAGMGVFAVTMLPLMVGQAAFGPPSGSWPQFAVAVPEALLGSAIVGAIGAKAGRHSARQPILHARRPPSDLPN